MNIQKIYDFLLCSYVSIGVMFLYCLMFFIVDFTLYCITGKCILHTIYKIIICLIEK